MMKRLVCAAWLLVFLCTIIFLGAACGGDKQSNLVEYELYFANAAKDSLSAESAYIEKEATKNPTALAQKVIQALLEGPRLEGNSAVIPEGTKLRGISLDETDQGIINVDLSREYYSFKKADSLPSEELLARYSIVTTLCQFDSIKKVKLYVNGEDMLSASGKDEVLPPLGLNSVMINSPSSVETQTEKFVTLYFTDKSGKYLYPETRKATMSDNSLEKTVVHELIRGPVSNSYSRTFSETANLISIETTEGVCFVNFSASYLLGIDGKQYNEDTAVFSVVNSLTRLPNIEKVQILIDGKKPENDAYKLFSTPLGHDDTIIKK